MALIADRNTQMKDGDLLPVPMAAVKIFAGGLVAANATGYATPGAVAATLTYLGRAEETVDNTAGAAGAKTVLVRFRKAFKWLNHGADPVTQASMGKVCYIVDDQTVALTTGGATRSAAGVVVGLDADGVWVR
jgi:hypothetical protein